MLAISAAQVHLALNHFPVFAGLFAAAALLFGIAFRREAAQRLGLGLVVFAALSAVPTFYSGEDTEEIVEHRQGVSEARIERHEEAAESAFGVLLAAGAFAAVVLVARRVRPDSPGRALAGIVLLVTVTATGMMLQVAHLGGQIRHDEIRSASTSAALQRHDD